ncbi:hypothetical protein HJC23_000696 [Cyclotella cryptica]|uniref:Uncharacterized protein n=1 Tax=Cyclotella cryptica TaxID=29204 RepID=A0ABD3Q9D1_9STRA|eukprot:CCRYP_007375-RA/>CCRYP_007375-RA protein AED:0.15 eAED:0.15 QI:0/-1/0/1/-1/1/1/0/358
MSDLFPLVVEVLKDAAILAAKQENEDHRRQSDITASIEVIRSIEEDDEGDVEAVEDKEAVIYATGRVDDGEYKSSPGEEPFNLAPRLWYVKFQSKQICMLSDLMKCRVCVGGGFPIVSFGDYHETSSLTLQSEEEDTQYSKCISFCPDYVTFPIWVRFIVHGWPLSEYSRFLRPGRQPQENENLITFLVDDVARDHPYATVQFVGVAVPIKTVHGTLSRLLTGKKKLVARSVREALKFTRSYDSNWLRVRMRSLFHEHNADPPTGRLFFERINALVDVLDEIELTQMFVTAEFQHHPFPRALKRDSLPLLNIIVETYLHNPTLVMQVLHNLKKVGADVDKNKLAALITQNLGSPSRIE